MTKKIVTFNPETHIGEINKKAFNKGLPEGVTPELIEAVDEYRDGFLGKIAGETLDHANIAFASENAPEVVTVARFPMGGLVAGEVMVDPTYQLLASHVIENSTIMSAVLSRAQDLHKETVCSEVEIIEA